MQRLNDQLEQQNKLLKLKEEQLGTQYHQLDAALNNIVQGLAMFDAEHRLVLCNSRYAEIYHLTPEQVQPGTTLKQIIEHRMANGLKSEMSADDIVSGMLRRRDETGSAIFYSQLSDGRCLAITVRPMADGGTVTTHQDITEQRRSEAKIAHMAHHDALTGLPNRVLLNQQLEQAFARAKRGEKVAAHFLDLDYFKNVNDTLGHAAGDKLLKMVAERLRALARDADIVARMGGDEFAILQAGVAQPADAGSLARRVIESISRPYEIDGQQVIIGTSVGIAIGPGDGQNPEALMRNADLALYRAKEDGRGAFRFFEPEMDAQMQERRTMEVDLRRALAAGQFELHYQPIVNLATNDISAFEALIRWRHPHEGPHRAQRIHSTGGGDRLHRSDRRMGDAAGLRYRRHLARRCEGHRQSIACAVPQPRTRAGGRGRACGIGPAGRSPGAGDHGNASCCRTTRRRSTRSISCASWA